MRTRLVSQGIRSSLALVASLLAGCGTSPSPSGPTGAGTDAGTDVATGAGADGARVEDVPSGPRFTASCVYTNAFSRAEECRDYIDPDWTEATVATDCTNARGTLRMGSACSYPAALGQCVIDVPNVKATRITFPGSDASQCAATQRGCQVFARGMFTPLGVCAGGATPDAGMTGGMIPPENVFQPPVRQCRDPLPGQPRGNGPNGQVCTWASVAASTEEGRRYEDYASCDRVRTQRPYYPSPAGEPRGDDPRMRDPAYVTELNWVRSQVEASACVCCHSRRATPDGPSDWYIEAPGNWVDSFHDTGLALGAGWIDSRALGAFPTDQNNGFDRINSGVPSTDPARMRRFFERELMHRGRTRESFASAQPFGGPIYEQLVYTPSACTGTDGIAADGTLRWTGGGARYLYVLDRGSQNPGVPPNLDLPEGTRWRVDVAHTDAPIQSGVVYGRTPMGASQRFPASGAPTALTPGSSYYLYVLADVGIPITRCIFTVPR